MILTKKVHLIVELSNKLSLKSSRRITMLLINQIAQFRNLVLLLTYKVLPMLFRSSMTLEMDLVLLIHKLIRFEVPNRLSLKEKNLLLVV